MRSVKCAAADDNMIRFCGLCRRFSVVANGLRPPHVTPSNDRETPPSYTWKSSLYIMRTWRYYTFTMFIRDPRRKPIHFDYCIIRRPIRFCRPCEIVGDFGARTCYAFVECVRQKSKSCVLSENCGQRVRELIFMALFPAGRAKTAVDVLCR